MLHHLYNLDNYAYKSLDICKYIWFNSKYVYLNIISFHTWNENEMKWWGEVSNKFQITWLDYGWTYSLINAYSTVACQISAYL